MANDNPIMVQFTLALLAMVGYHTLNADTGAAALLVARAYSGTIHLLISAFDTRGMSGIELGTQLQRERPSMRILLVSAGHNGLLVLNNGWTYIPKPFVAEQFKDRVRDFLSEQPRLDEHLVFPTVIDEECPPTQPRVNAQTAD